MPKNFDYPFDTEDDLLLHFTPGIGGVPWSSDAWGWPDEFNTYRIFDWRAGDGTTPLVGPTLTKTGSPSSAKTPFSNRLGAMSAETFSSTQNYVTSGSSISCDPSPTEDVVWLVLCESSGQTGARFAMRTGLTPGIVLYEQAANSWVIRVRSTTSAITYYSFPTYGFGWTLFGFVWSISENSLRPYANGKIGTPASLVDGSFSSTTLTFGSQNVAGSSLSIARLQVFKGVGIGPLFSTSYLGYHSAAIFGLTPQKPKTPMSFTRTGAVNSIVGIDMFPISASVPRCESSKGVALAPALVNKCYRNTGIATGDEVYIAVTTGLTKTTESVSIEYYNFYGFVGTVFSVSNDTGSDGIVYQGDTSGNTNKRSVSVRAHQTRGTGCEVGLRNNSTGIFTSGAAISNNFVRTHAIITPFATSDKWAIKLPTGTTVQFFLQNNVESPVIAPEIINLASASSASTGTSSINYGVKLTGTSALVEAEVAPDGWSTTAEGQARAILTDSTSSGRHMEINSSSQLVIVNDGTNNAQVAITEADGVYQTVRTGWGPGGLVTEVGGTQDRDPYDGTLGFGQAMTTALNRWLRRLTILRRER